MRGMWTTERVRVAEQRLMRRVSEGTLMRRAAFGVSVSAARLLAERTGKVAGRRVVLLVGAGNNGGDALWAGAYLRRRGVGVVAVLLKPERAHPAGLAALRTAGGRVVHADATGDTVGELLAAADLVIDGIVGLSARGPLRPEAARAYEWIAAPVLAVDTPSGVDPDTGAVDGPAVQATATVTFGARKPVHALAPTYCGRVELVDLGFQDELGAPDMCALDDADVAAHWPVPEPADDKYTQGVAGIAAGSATYPGAAVLSAAGAVLATSGMVRYAGHAADAVRAHWPEIVATGTVADAGRVQTWLTGPGIGTGTEGADMLRTVLAAGVPVCADADALTLLANHPEILDSRDPRTPLLLTPHDGEFARLVGEQPGPDRVRAACAAARRFDATLLLKGHATIVAAPDGRVVVNTPAGSWPATAGSGDVLAGMLAALLAGGLDPLHAGGTAARVHALAAARAAAGAPTSASGILAAVPETIRRLWRGDQP